MTLVEFLLARIADDQERAEFVQRQNTPSWGGGFEPWRLSWQDEYDLLCIEPSRALAECESKRRLIHWYGDGGDIGDGGEFLRLLALPYTVHPDFNPAWNVTADAGR